MEPGTVIAGYRIESVLGQGGMGTVFEATQMSLNRTVALKLLSPQLGADASFVERFRREGRIQAAIDHPNIVTVYEAGELEHGLFIAMRLVRGGTLKDLIIGRELEGARTLRLLKPIADALDTAHEAGLTHRDIKPQNILVGVRDHAYLADFGLTKGIQDTGLTKTGAFVGTLDYISPEQIQGKAVGPPSDIYALGAVLYECLTGVVPYPKPSDAAVLYAHMADPPPRVTDQRPELPGDLDEVILRAMAKDPGERHATATELIADAERRFGRRVRAVITPPGPVEGPEEIGLRTDESKVPTRESRLRELPADMVPAEPQAPADGDSQQREETSAPPLRPTAAAIPPSASTGTTRRVQRPTERRTGRPTVRAPTDGARVRRAPVPVLAGAALLAAVLLGAAGFAVGRGGGEDAPSVPALTGAASTAEVQLGVPASWQRATVAPDIPGLEPIQPLVLRSRTQPDVGLVAGRVRDAAPNLLPASLLDTLDEPPEPGERVRIGEVQALRYADLRPGGFAGALDVLAIPTGAGTVVIACHAPRGALEDARPTCDRIAGTVQLQVGDLGEAGPLPAYARMLGATLTGLRREVAERRRALTAARTRQGQARTAEGLARVYAGGARALRRAQVDPGARAANVAVSSSLAQTAEGYERLASAADDGDQARYRAAAAAIRAGERAIAAALAALEDAGYRVG